MGGAEVLQEEEHLRGGGRGEQVARLGILPGWGSVERCQLEGLVEPYLVDMESLVRQGQWRATKEEKEHDLCFRRDPGFHG